MGQDLVHGDPRSTSLQEAQVPHDSSRAQDALRGGAGPSGSRDETHRVWSLQQQRLEKLVANLVPAMLGGNPSYLRTFLGSCRSFATAQQVLDLLLQRYGCILPSSDEDGGPLHQLKQAMTSILGTWLHQYPEDFLQPPGFPCLKPVLAYIELSIYVLNKMQGTREAGRGGAGTALKSASEAQACSPAAYPRDPLGTLTPSPHHTPPPPRGASTLTAIRSEHV
nr:ral guanine nucleotide dissociation stimulator-like [Camelus dromedarius]